MEHPPHCSLAERVAARQRKDDALEPGSSPVSCEAVPHPWDGYLTGPENELAFAAAQAMARGEHEGISPVLVCGSSGVGKSRLLAGLVVERLARLPRSAVAHLEAQAFAAACAEAACEPSGAGWSRERARFRSVDLFILEDIEDLRRNPLACRELVHTLDALDAGGAGVVISAQATPARWSRQEWPARLLNRLLGGLTVQITPPGPGSRRRYVYQLAGQHGLALQAEAVELLVQAADGYRHLSGWINRLALEARLLREREGPSNQKGLPTSCQGKSPREGPELLAAHTVASLLAQEACAAKPLVAVGTVAQAVGKQFGIPLGELRGPSRRASVTFARHVAMHLARTVTGSSFAAIGTYFGGRDPSTVRHACRAAASRFKSDPGLAASAAALAQAWLKAEL
jgi:chromosomal replication initiator protein